MVVMIRVLLVISILGVFIVVGRSKRFHAVIVFAGLVVAAIQT